MTRKKKTWLVIAVLAAVVAGALTLRAYRARAFDPDAVSVPILMYHSVCPDKALAGRYIVTDDTFRSDMEYLKARGYTAVSVEQLADYVQNGTALPEKPVMITLDDGYLNNLTDALPILRDTGMRAVVSVAGAASDAPGENRDSRIAYAHLNWDEVKELSDSGIVEIENHTWNMHGDGKTGRKGCTKMPGETDEEYRAALKADLSKLQGVLKEKTGSAPLAFTYPYGKISAGAEDVLKELGFKAAFTCHPEINHIVRDPEQLFSLGRINRPSGISTGLFMRLAGIK